MSKCGKTPLVRKLVENKYLTDFKKLVGVGILTRDIKLSNGEIVGVSIWDISELGKFDFIKKQFYTGGSGAILVFDISRKETWEAIKEHQKKMCNGPNNIPFMLLGNKLEKLDGSDKRTISFDECKTWAEENNGFYVETRSENLQNIDEGMIKLTKMIIKAKGFI